MQLIFFQFTKIYTFALLLTFCTFLYAGFEKEKFTTDTSLATYEHAVSQLKSYAQRKGRKLNVVVFYTSGGFGHKSAADAVEASLTLGNLKEVFNVIQLDFFHNSIMRYLEPVVFNYLCKHEHWKLMQVYQKGKKLREDVRPFLQKSKIQNSLEEATEELDFIISVNFVGNKILYDIANERNTPFFLIPTDFEISKFLFNLHDIPENDSFKVLIPFYDELLIDPLKEQSIESIAYTGYPTRKSFIDTTVALLKNDEDTEAKLQEKKRLYNINENDNVVVISMGGFGFAEQTTLNYITSIANNLQQLKHPRANKIHVLVITGANSFLFDRVSHLKESITSPIFDIHPLEFQSVEDMAILLSPKFSDFIIGKTGGATTSELLITGLPILVNADNHAVLSFEKQNAELLKKKGQAQLLTSSSDYRTNEQNFIEAVQPFFHREKHPVLSMVNMFHLALPIEVMKSLQPFF